MAGSTTRPLPGFRADVTDLPLAHVSSGLFRLDRFDFLNADRYEKLNSVLF